MQVDAERAERRRIGYLPSMPEDSCQQAGSRRNVFDIASLIAIDLRRERRAQGFTLERLSELTGLAIANIHTLESTGQGRVASLRRAADALSVRIVGLPGRSFANDLPSRFGQARQKAGLTVSDLAAKAGVSREAVLRVEQGGGNLSTLYAGLTVLRRPVRLRNERAKVWAPAIGDRDSRFTPQEVLDALVSIFGAISLDPCWSPRCLVRAESVFTKEDDGLARDWEGKFVWVNPPYSNSRAWAIKCRAEYEAGRARTVVGLFKGTTYGETFQQIALTADTIFLSRRVKFLGPTGERIGSGTAPFGLVLYMWGASPIQISATIAALGGRHLPAERSRLDL